MAGAGAAVCAVCGMQAHPRWLGACPGVRVYTWAEIPEAFATKTQLVREGLRVAGYPAGCYITWRRKAVVLLYDRTAAQPKRTLSEKQQAALTRSIAALQASRTCTCCHDRVQSKSFLYAVDEGERLCRECLQDWGRELDERDVCRWAAGLLAGKDGDEPVTLRILDTETTGLYRDAEVIEVAILDARGRVLVDTRIKPQESIPAEATAIHGLTDADIANAPTLPEVWPHIWRALRGTLVLAYNAEFDERMRVQSAARYGLTRPVWRWSCLMEACTAFSWDGQHYMSLAAMAFWLHVPSGRHRARGDAQAALGVLRALAQRANRSTSANSRG